MLTLIDQLYHIRQLRAQGQTTVTIDYMENVLLHVYEELKPKPKEESA